ncbi:MAG: hypothetical protein N3A60_07915 [Thermanaerothrix sp.]|nr:hypothetical protein [Thermanaerothrix sp.]
MNTDSPVAWLIIVLLCAFTLVTNFALVSLWRHRQYPSQHRSPQVNLRLPEGGFRLNEEAEWERLAQAVQQLPLDNVKSPAHNHEVNSQS